MNQQLLTAESDEIADSTAFSLVAFVGLIFSSIGVFSVEFIQVMPLSIVGGLIGAFVLVTAKRSRLSWLSRTLGFLAVVLGATVASWGLFAREIFLQSELTQAKHVAEEYLTSLSKGDMNKVKYLVGFQLSAADSGGVYAEGESEAQRAARRLSEDPAHVEIKERRTPSKWEFVRLEGEYVGSVGYTYKLTYQDVGQTTPRRSWVFVRKEGQKYEVKKKFRWFVDSLESAKKL